jgi:hypothetical protein
VLVSLFRPNRSRLLILLASIGGLQIATIRAGHQWGDDFAHYILQAKHMLAGDGFVAREYLPNPEVLNLGPQTVPPGLSVVLLPVYAVSGLNFTAMKVLLILGMLACLWLTDQLFEDRLPPGWRLALVALIGLNPVIFDLRDSIETEKPFLVFELLALYLMVRAWRSREKPPLWEAVALGLTIFAACATRNVGVALLPTLAVMSLFAFRRLGLFAMVSGAIALAGTLPVFRMLRTVSGYRGSFHFSPSWMMKSAVAMAKTTQNFWWTSTPSAVAHPRFIAYITLVMAGGFALYGAWLSVRRGPGPIELFPLFYLPIICAYFAPRFILYLLPVFPFYVGYLLIGLRDVEQRLPRGKILVAALASAAVLLYIVCLGRAGWGPIREGIGDTEFVQLTGFIRSQTAPSDLLLFRKPRLLALLTERTSSVYPIHLDRPTTPDEIRAYIEKTHARYLITSPVFNEPDSPQTDAALDEFVTRFKEHVTLVYSSPRYRLYRLGLL